MQCGNRSDHRDIRFRQRVFIRDLNQAAQENVRHRAHMQNMLAAFVVAVFDNMAQNIDHRVVRLFTLVDLLLHKAHKALLAGIQHERIFDTAADDRQIERSADVIRSAEIIAAADEIHIAFGRDDDNRHLADPMPQIHNLQHAETVHFRHVDIEHHEVDIIVFFEDIDGFCAVFCHDIFVFIAEYFLKEHLVHFRIVRDEYFFL